MASLFDDIDVQRTRKAAEDELKQYRKLNMIARRPIEQKITVSYDSQPKGSRDSTPEIERKVIAKQIAEQQAEAIRNAVDSLSNEKHKKILNELYIHGYDKNDTQVYNYFDWPTSSYYRYKNEALEAFSWAFGCEVYTGTVPQYTDKCPYQPTIWE